MNENSYTAFIEIELKSARAVGMEGSAAHELQLRMQNQIWGKQLVGAKLDL